VKARCHVHDSPPRRVSCDVCQLVLPVAYWAQRQDSNVANAAAPELSGAPRWKTTTSRAMARDRKTKLTYGETQMNDHHNERRIYVPNDSTASTDPMASIDRVPDWAKRESLITLTLLSAALLVGGHSRDAQAFSLADLSQGDASAGVKAALEKGALIAVGLLGKRDGFWANDKVRIPLPEWIAKAEKGLKVLGRSKDVANLKEGINRAAEQAVPESKILLQNAVKSMTVTDAKKILTGGDTSVTTFFKDKTAAPLTEKFLPIVTGVTDKIGLANQYNQLAGQIEKSGLVKLKPDQARVERHVTTKSLDGLYTIIGEEEKKIRQDPVGTGSDILRRVFGAIKR
jgi:hypothetical protein